MTAIIRFTPVYGSQREEPLCFLLEVDESCILLDCGWNTSFDVNLLQPLKRYISRIDAVLVTYPDITHLGALPYIVGKWGLRVNIYASMPVYKMGLMFMYDAYQSKANSELFTTFNLDDVDNAFDHFVQLKYSQRVTLKGGIEISPHCAGHMIGGTIWKIKKETEEIIYAVDYNHKKERHLNGCTLETLGRPSLLITDAFSVTYPPINKKQRDSEFLETIMQSLRNNGNVLLPVDTSGRVLELLIILDQYWSTHKLNAYSVAFLSYLSFNTIEFAKSQLEWMSDSVMKAFDYSRDNPFAFKHVRLCHDIEQVNQLPGPMVVLATMNDLEYGFARDLLPTIVENPKNTIIFTERPFKGTLAHKLLEKPTSVVITLKKRVPLEGKELEAYEQKLKEQEQETQRSNAMEESDSESDDDLSRSKIPFQNSYEMTAADFISGGFKQPMFPYIEKHPILDEYGETLIPTDFAFEFMESIESKESKPKEELETDEKSSMDIEGFEDKPSKYLVVAKTLQIQCTIKYIDYEGRADGRSIKALLNNVAPRKMILIHGSAEEKEQLKIHSEKVAKVPAKLILCPENEERVDVTPNTHIFKVKLKDSLMDKLQFHNVGDYKIAYLNASVVTGDKGDVQSVPSLDYLPPSEAEGHRAVFVGEVKLSDLKQLLANNGYKSDLYGGVLITANGSIAIKKKEVDGQSTLRIEGVISNDYFRVRDLLYSQYTVL